MNTKTGILNWKNSKSGVTPDKILPLAVYLLEPFLTGNRA